jgi:hypothetical protein
VYAAPRDAEPDAEEDSDEEDEDEKADAEARSAAAAAAADAAAAGPLPTDLGTLMDSARVARRAMSRRAAHGATRSRHVPR